MTLGRDLFTCDPSGDLGGRSFVAGPRVLIRSKPFLVLQVVGPDGKGSVTKGTAQVTERRSVLNLANTGRKSLVSCILHDQTNVILLHELNGLNYITRRCNIHCIFWNTAEYAGCIRTAERITTLVKEYCVLYGPWIGLATNQLAS